MLVTGASGFLGQPLVERLATMGYRITALGMRQKDSPFSPKVEYAAGDLADADSTYALLNPWRWDAIINLAGPMSKNQATWDEDCQTLSQHVNIVLNVCLAIPQTWMGRLVHVSSMVVYGIPERLPVDESHPRRPVNAYGAAKVLAEDALFAVARKNHLDCWALRLPGLFCETRQSGALSRFMRAAAEGHPLLVSAPQPTPWDVLHLADAIEGIVRALMTEERNPGAVNLGYGSPVELVTMAEQIAARAGTRVRVDNIDGVRHPTFQMDIRKARSLLNWPPTTLQERLESMWEALKYKQRSEVS